jgi:hypothetical protein
MAAAIREPLILQRTFTIYGDLDRVTGPLGIKDRSTVSVFCVDRSGQVLWRGVGGYSEEHALEIESVISAHRSE